MSTMNDSLVIAKRNLIRMTRDPNPVRSVGFRSISGFRADLGKRELTGREGRAA
ncbi:hypothetical protein ACIGW7_38850 [Streptomyces sp. NPDC053253]|uniref:hypothetical protein n=1 Tax=Streptomyces sp. NPDC053253 TaxID=3365699 RepID=UPI0037D36F6B